MKLIPRSLKFAFLLCAVVGCQKPSIHGSGYGGSDGLWTQITASHRIMVGKIRAWASAPAPAKWCEPVNCDQFPMACNVVSGLAVSPARKIQIQNYMASPANAAKYLARAEAASFVIQDNLEGYADALTPLLTTGEYTIRFDR